MAANIIIKGIEKVIKRDLEKHKVLLERCQVELLGFRTAVSHEIKKKKYYKSLIGGAKFNDEALEKSMNMIAVNIRHMSDKAKTSKEAIAHHSLIVDTLTEQLQNQEEALRVLAEHHRSRNAACN